MIRFRISVILLAVIAVLSVLATVYLVSLSQHLEAALTLLAGSEPPSAAAFEEASGIWQSERGLLRFLLDRDKLEAAEAALREADAALRSSDIDAFRQRCAWIQAYLEGLLRSELPTLQNIF